MPGPGRSAGPKLCQPRPAARLGRHDEPDLLRGLPGPDWDAAQRALRRMRVDPPCCEGRSPQLTGRSTCCGVRLRAHFGGQAHLVDVLETVLVVPLFAHVLEWERRQRRERGRVARIDSRPYQPHSGILVRPREGTLSGTVKVTSRRRDRRKVTLTRRVAGPVCLWAQTTGCFGSPDGEPVRHGLTFTGGDREGRAPASAGCQTSVGRRAQGDGPWPAATTRSS